MGATSIHVQAVKPGSEIHNFREKELDFRGEKGSRTYTFKKYHKIANY